MDVYSNADVAQSVTVDLIFLSNFLVFSAFSQTLLFSVPHVENEYTVTMNYKLCLFRHNFLQIRYLKEKSLKSQNRSTTIAVQMPNYETDDFPDLLTFTVLGLKSVLKVFAVIKKQIFIYFL